MTARPVNPAEPTERWRSDRRATVIEFATVVGVLLVMAAAGASLIGHGFPLGWDESVYASRSRSLVTDVPESVWKIYRPPGLPIVGLLGGAFGFTDANLRAVSLVLSVLTLGGAWALSRALWGPLAAVIGLLTIVGAPVVLDELVLFQTDLPAAGLLLALMLLLWHEFERRPEPTSLLLAAAPIAAAAFYLRYGTVIAIVGIGLAAVLLWHGSILRHRRLVGATVVFAALLLAPHLVEATVRTGSPIGIVTTASDQVNTSGPLLTAARYLGWLPVQLVHRLGFAVIVAGAVYAAATALVSIRTRRSTPAARRLAFLYVPAGLTTLGLVLLSHPEPRYVMFPVLLAIIAGAGAVSALVGWLGTLAVFASRPRALDATVVAGLVLAAVVVASVGVRRMDALERDGERTRWWAEVGSAIRADSHGPCTAATTLAPIIGWYSGCDGIAFINGGAEALAAGRDAEPVYLVFTDLDGQRATVDAIERYRSLVDRQTAAVIAVPGAPTAVNVYRLAP